MKSLFSSGFGVLFSFATQAGFSVLMFLIIGRLLSAAEYVSFSLALATVVFSATGLFEWVRLSTARHYSTVDETNELEQRFAIYVEYYVSAALGVVLALGAWAAGLFDFKTAIGVSVLSLMQGASDIQLMMLRFRAAFRIFVKVQSTRAILQASLAVCVAYVFRSSFGVILAMAFALALTLSIALWIDPHLRFPVGYRPQALRANVKAHILYGIPATVASTMNAGAVIVLRYAIPAVSTQQFSSGALLAIDLMQKPYNVVLAALHSIYYPRLVQSFDAGDGRAAYRNLISVESTAAAGLFAMFAGTLPFVAPLIVASEAQEGFVSACIIALLLFGMRSYFLNVSYLKYHLHKKTLLIMLFSALDLVLYYIYILGFRFFSSPSAVELMIGCTALSVVLVLTAFVVGRRYPLTPEVRTGGLAAEGDAVDVRVPVQRKLP